MPVSATTLRRLAALELSPQAMAEVLSIIAEVEEGTGSQSPGAIRTRRWRDKKTSQQVSPGDVTVTSQKVTEPVTHASARAEPKITNSSSTHSEIKEEEKQETRASALRSVGFEEFWSIWPNKVGKHAAEKAWAPALGRAGSLQAILDGVAVYVRTKPPDRNWMNPATFLNQDRWNDRPASTGPPVTRQASNGLAAYARKRFGLNGTSDGPPSRHPSEQQHSGPTIDIGAASVPEPTVSRPALAPPQSGTGWPTRQ